MSFEQPNSEASYYTECTVTIRNRLRGEIITMRGDAGEILTLRERFLVKKKEAPGELDTK